MNDELIHVAWLLLYEGGEDTVQARSRRAVSTAYYALFHALAAASADALVDGTPSVSNWLRVYRSLEHRRAITVLQKLPPATTSPRLRIFAAAFVELQEMRHVADYDPTYFAAERASLLGLQATQANQQFEMVERSERLDLATHLLFKSRP